MNTPSFKASDAIATTLLVVTAIALMVGIHTASVQNNQYLTSAHRAVSLHSGLVPVAAQILASHSPSAWRVRMAGRHSAVLQNPAQNLLVTFNRSGAVLYTGPGRKYSMTFQLTAYRSGNVALPITHDALSIDGDRVQLSHGYGPTEWYVNSPLGVEQGFTLASRQKALPAARRLELVFSLHGNLAPVQIGNSIEFRTRSGQAVLHYGKLLALDAHRRPLPAKLHLVGHKLLLAVNVSDAAYPIVIDPLFSVMTTFSDPNNAMDYFGGSVALSADGNTALIGADVTTVSSNSSEGMAYIFTRINGVWSSTPTQTFTDPVGAANDLFGESVALSQDGNTALIGAVGTNNDAGAAYVYTRTNGVWSSTPTQSFADPTATANDQFGIRVALSGDGSTALIGAIGTTVSGKSFVGAAYAYSQSSGIWPSTPTHSFADPIGATDAFGLSVALSNNGTTALIGASGTSVSGKSGAGAAYIFTQTSGVWSSTPTHTFNDPLATSGDSFGSSAALSSDGSVALVGATSDIAGNSNVGTAYVYAQSGGVWPNAPTQSFTDPKNNADDFFGWSVALSSNGTVALVGAYGLFGAAYAYIQSNGVWPNTPTNTIVDPVSGGGHSFGLSVALTSDGSGALIGSPQATNKSYFFAPSVDLSLALSSSPASVAKGQSISYMLTVANNDAQATAANLTLTDTLPTGVNFVSATAAGGTCSNSSGTVTCALASLAPQATWQPSINVNATATGSLIDNASVKADQTDPDTSNNSASVTTTVSATSSSSGSGSGGGGGAFGWLSLLLLAMLLGCRNREVALT